MDNSTICGNRVVFIRASVAISSAVKANKKARESSGFSLKKRN
jgi:hypothetical protein